MIERDFLVLLVDEEGCDLGIVPPNAVFEAHAIGLVGFDAGAGQTSHGASMGNTQNRISSFDFSLNFVKIFLQLLRALVQIGIIFSRIKFLLIADDRFKKALSCL